MVKRHSLKSNALFRHYERHLKIINDYSVIKTRERNRKKNNGKSLMNEVVNKLTLSMSENPHARQGQVLVQI